MGQLWGFSSEVFPAACGWTCCYSLEHSQQKPHPLNALPYFYLPFLISSPYPVMKVLPVAGCSGTERVFSSSIPHSWGTWALSHFSPFSLRRGCCQLVQSQAVQPWGTGGTDKFLLTLSNARVLCLSFLFVFFGFFFKISHIGEIIAYLSFSV